MNEQQAGELAHSGPGGIRLDPEVHIREGLEPDLGTRFQDAMQQNLSVQYLIGQIRKQGCLSVDCSFLSSQRSHHPSCAACEYVMGFSSLLWMWLVVNLNFWSVPGATN